MLIPGMRLAGFVIAVTSAFLAASACYPVLRWERRERAWALVALALPIALSPLWVPRDVPGVRLLATLNAVSLLVKLYDLHVAASCSLVPSFPCFAAFLANWFCLVWRRLDKEPQPSFQQILQRLAWAALQTGAAVIVLVWLVRRDWAGTPFAVEHCAKALSLFVALIPLSALGVSFWRLAGGRPRDFMAAPLFAPTPVEFWRRYNRPAQQFLKEDGFVRARSTQSPAPALFMTFALSALVHEYVFGVSMGRVQGYQTVFFLLQGLGVAATARVHPTGRAPWTWI